MSASPNAGAVSIRPGGRSARVRAEVLSAVREELTTHGYDGLSVEAVARRSGVHRATVYRRWKDVGGLLADTVEEAPYATTLRARRISLT